MWAAHEWRLHFSALLFRKIVLKTEKNYMPSQMNQTKYILNGCVCLNLCSFSRHSFKITICTENSVRFWIYLFDVERKKTNNWIIALKKEENNEIKTVGHVNYLGCELWRHCWRVTLFIAFIYYIFFVCHLLSHRTVLIQFTGLHSLVLY